MKVPKIDRFVKSQKLAALSFPRNLPSSALNMLTCRYNAAKRHSGAFYETIIPE